LKKYTKLPGIFLLSNTEILPFSILWPVVIQFLISDERLKQKAWKARQSSPPPQV
jgi:hypothetical protein